MLIEIETSDIKNFFRLLYFLRRKLLRRSIIFFDSDRNEVFSLVFVGSWKIVYLRARIKDSQRRLLMNIGGFNYRKDRIVLRKNDSRARSDIILLVKRSVPLSEPLELQVPKLIKVFDAVDIFSYAYYARDAVFIFENKMLTGVLTNVFSNKQKYLVALYTEVPSEIDLEGKKFVLFNPKNADILYLERLDRKHFNAIPIIHAERLAFQEYEEARYYVQERIYRQNQ